MLVKRNDGKCLNLNTIMIFEEKSEIDNRPTVKCTTESGYVFIILDMTLTRLKSNPMNSIINCHWIASNCKFADIEPSNNDLMIQLAKIDRIKKLRLYVDRFLIAVGHPEGLVTDESYVSDFLSLVAKERVSQTRKLRKVFGLDKKLNISNFKVYEFAEYLQKKGF